VGKLSYSNPTIKTKDMPIFWVLFMFRPQITFCGIQKIIRSKTRFIEVPGTIVAFSLQ
jgi:hypothetical protein